MAVKVLVYNLASIVAQPIKQEMEELQRKREVKKPETKYDYKICKVYSIELLIDNIEDYLRAPLIFNIKLQMKNFRADLIRNPSSIHKEKEQSPRQKKTAWSESFEEPKNK